MRFLLHPTFGLINIFLIFLNRSGRRKELFGLPKKFKAHNLDTSVTLLFGNAIHKMIEPLRGEMYFCIFQGRTLNGLK